MRYKSMINALLGLAVGTSLGCGKTSDNKAPAPQPLPAPTMAPVPLPAVDPVDPLAYDKPVAGFTFEDLVNGSYCTVKVKNSEQVYLLADVWKFAADQPLTFTYYFPENEDLVYHSAVATNFSLTSSNCDLEKLVDANPVSLLLAPITVYANKEFSGEPACTVAAGSRSLSEEDLESYHQAYVGVRIKTPDTCSGLTKGYLKSIPNIVTLYVRP